MKQIWSVLLLGVALLFTPGALFLIIAFLGYVMFTKKRKLIVYFRLLKIKFNTLKK